MSIGPGKYDDLCTKVREDTAADAVVLIVLRGNLGSGFSVQALGEPLSELPAILEFMAKQIRAAAGH